MVKDIIKIEILDELTKRYKWLSVIPTNVMLVYLYFFISWTNFFVLKYGIKLKRKRGRSRIMPRNF